MRRITRRKGNKVLDESSTRKGQGTATVLALLVALLLGYGGPGSRAEVDTRAARLGSADTVRPASLIRTSQRTEADDSDASASLMLPSAPQQRTELLSSRPAGAETHFVAIDHVGAAPLAYRARAPPAAA
jgi:hypothetical protein